MWFESLGHNSESCFDYLTAKVTVTVGEFLAKMQKSNN